MASESQKSLWWHTAGPPPQMQSLDGDVDADVAIVGGGYVGLTAALHLVGRGVRVAVLEAERVGAGASGLNAGFVVPNFAKADPAATIARLGEARGRALLDLVGRGGDRVFETIRHRRIACDAAQTGWLQPAHTSAAEAARARVDLWQSLGRPVEFVSGREVTRLTGMANDHGAVLDRSGGTIQPLSYLRGLARAAMEGGARIYERAPVTSAQPEGTRWRLDCGGPAVTADNVLLCTNAAALGVGRRLARAIVPLPVYQIATEPLPAETAQRIAPERLPVSDMRGNLFTYRLDCDDRLISGGMAAVPIGAHQRMARAIAARLARELRLPQVPKVAFVWRGVAAMTTDFLPHLYELGSGLVGAIGCNGRGIAMTAMLGEVLADAAMGTPLADLPVPTAPPSAVPLRPLAGIAASAVLLHARWQDWRVGAG